MRTLLGLITLIASIYIVSVALSPSYFHNIGFLDGVDGVRNITWGDVENDTDTGDKYPDDYYDDENGTPKDSAVKADEKEHERESEEWQEEDDDEAKD